VDKPIFTARLGRERLRVLCGVRFANGNYCPGRFGHRAWQGQAAGSLEPSDMDLRIAATLGVTREELVAQIARDGRSNIDGERQLYLDSRFEPDPKTGRWREANRNNARSVREGNSTDGGLTSTEATASKSYTWAAMSPPIHTRSRLSSPASSSVPIVMS